MTPTAINVPAAGGGAQHVAEGGDDQEPLRRRDVPGAVRADLAAPAHGREPGVPAMPAGFVRI